MDLHVGPLMMLGPTMDPQVAHAISLRVPHLPIRMVEHACRAQMFAERLHDLGVRVAYPAQITPTMSYFDGLGDQNTDTEDFLTIDTGSRAKAESLMEDLQNTEGFGFMAVSLGYFDTLMSCSASSTASELSDDALRAAGIAPGLLRMSIGFTGSLEQRWQQLERSLMRTGLI